MCKLTKIKGTCLAQ